MVVDVGYFERLKKLGDAYPSGPSAGKSLASYFDDVERRPFEAPEGIGSYYSSRLRAPIGYTDFSQPAAPYQPPGPPVRFQANLLGPRPEDSLLQTAPARFLLGQPTPVQDRTTSVDFMGRKIATTPIDFQNAATYAREAQLSLITSALGHRGQAPDEGLGRPKQAADHTTEDIATNLGQLDFKGVVDNIIDGMQTVGDTVFAPLDAFTRTVRNSAARDRAEGVAALFSAGQATPSLTQYLLHLFDSAGLAPTYAEVVKKAAAKGKTDVEMIAELYDLRPEVVAAIRDKGLAPTGYGLFGAEYSQGDQDWLLKATQDEPFSYNEIVNLIAEFGLMMVPFGAVAKGAGYLSRASRYLRGASGGARLAEADVAAGLVKGGEAGVTLVGNVPLTRLYKLAVPGKPLLTAERIGSWSMQRAWRVMNAKPTRIAGAVTGFSPTGMRIGFGIRAGEYLLKQIALNVGNEEAVATMDRWLWEQPLSTSPGLQIIDAFRVSPMAELKGTFVGAKKAYVHIAGKGDIPISPRLGRNLGALKDIPLPDLQRLVLDRLEWPADFMERVFGEGGPLSADDLRNGLFHVALQVVRGRHEARLRRFHTGLGAAERSELFVKEYGQEAVDVLRDEIRGRSHHIADAIRDEYWTRAEITDASELGGVGQIGPYHGYSAATRFVSWLHFSKWFAGVAEGAYVAKLRRDVNLDFLRAFREEIAKAYKPGDLVSAADLNRLLTFVPRAGDPKVLGGLFARFGGGRAIPRISRSQLETMLGELERLQGVEAMDTAYRPQTARLTEAAAADPAAIGTAFGLGTDTVTALLAGNRDGPIPGDLERVLERTRQASRAMARQQPELWWEKAAAWLKGEIAKAQRTERIMAAGERLSDAVAERMPGETRRTSALASIKAWAQRGTREYRSRELEEEASVDRRVDDRLADDLERVFADPAAKLVIHGPDGQRPWQIESGDRYVVESPTFDWRTANRIERLAPDASATPGLDPVSAATLVDPALRSIERVDALKAARAAGWDPPTPADREVVDTLPSLDEAYGGLADTYLERELGTPVTARDIGALESKARDIGARLYDITGKIAMRSIVADPARPVSPEVQSLRERGALFGVTRVEVGGQRRGEPTRYVESPNWYDLPLEQETTVRVSHEQQIELRRTQLINDARVARERLEAVEETARRADLLRGQQAQREWYTWDRENPVGTFPSRKKALEAAATLREAGEALIVEKIRDGRWALVRGTLKDEVAGRLEPEPVTEGQVAEVTPPEGTVLAPADPGAAPPVASVEGTPRPVRAEPPEPPLIVERIDEGQRQAEAERAAFDAEQEARQQAYAAHVAEWPAKVRLPGGAGEPVVAPELAPASEVTFLDPQDNKTVIRSRVVLVDAEAPLTSDRPGFPANLQPRSRDIRASSAEQIASYAADLQPGKLFGTTEGGVGMPVVTPEGVVLAGNARVMAIRLASRGQYQKYRDVLPSELAKYGYTDADIAGMERPVLVRELIDVDPVAQTRLAWQLNDKMPVGDLAPSMAAALTQNDIARFVVGEEQSIRDAVKSRRNEAVVAQMIGRLPVDWHTQYSDPATGITDLGVKLVAGALMSKLLRADDRTLPGFAAARRVVFEIVEMDAEEIRRIAAGFSEAAGRLLKAQDKAEAGLIGPELLAITDDIVPALARLIELRSQGLNTQGILNTLDNVRRTFDEFTFTSTQKHIARVLISSASQKEIRTFLDRIAEAAEANAPQEGALLAGERLDTVGVLNEGVKAWNAVRKAAGKSEIDPFPSTTYPYDTPLTGTRELPDGQTAPPVVRTQPLAPEEVGPEIEARTVGEEVVTEASVLADLADGPGRVRILDPEEARLAESLATSPDVLRADVEELVATAGRMREARRRALFAELLAKPDRTAAEWLFVREFGGGIRRNVDGSLNMTYAPPRNWPARLRGALDYHEGRLRDKEIVVDTAADAATVIRRAEQRPLTPEQLADDLGPDVPAVSAADTARAGEIASSSAHTLVVGGSPGLNRALRAAVGAPGVTDTTRGIFEFNARETMAQADRLDAARAKARAEAEAAERALADFEANPPLEATDVSAVLDEHLTDLWVRLMTGSGLDPLGGAWGDSRPTTLSGVVSAIESIDNGVIVHPDTGVGLTPAEAVELRAALVAIADANLARHAARLNVDLSESRLAQLRHQRAPRGPEADFEPGAARDELAGLMEQMKPLIVTNPDLPPLEGFMGTQYVPSLPPGGTADAPISPRILYRDYMARADDILPGLKEELAVGRMMEWGERVARSRFLRVMDAIVGPRPEKQIRANAIANLRREIVSRAERLAPEGLSEGALKELDQVIEVAFNRWRDKMEMIRIGAFRVFRRIDLLGGDMIRDEFAKAVADVYGKYGTEYIDRTKRPAGAPALTNPPEWYAALEREGWDAWRLWRRADNRLRQVILKQHTKVSDAIEAAYGRMADFGAAHGGRWAQVVYTALRFTMEVRWLALEAAEPYALMAPQGGLRAAAIRPGRGPSADRPPLGFGQGRQAGEFGSYAHWANVSDIEQTTLLRERMLMREVSRRQAKEFPKLIEELLTRDPALRRMMRDLGDTPQRFLKRLDRDWRLNEESTRKVSKAEAEALLRPWLEEGVINADEYARLVDSGRITMNEAIEAELRATVDNPVAQALYKRLAAMNMTMFHDATAMFFGQENRSNLQRFINSPILWWPTSYTIKSTKWLLRFMTEEAFGMDTRMMTGWALQEVYDEHVRRYREDPDYRASIAKHRNVAFLAQMLLPIVPWDVGTSLSPWARMVVDPNYWRDNGVFGWGLLYTFTNLVPGVLHEITGGSSPDADPLNLRRLAPRHITIRPKDRQNSSQTVAGEAPPEPGGIELPEEPEIRFR